MKHTTCTVPSLLIVFVAALSGCSEGIKTVPVYGKVTFPGRTVPKTCDIFFQPVKVEGASRPTTTKCEADGSYVARAFERSKGLIPGTYHLQLAYYDLKPGANPALEASWRQSTFDGGELVVDADSSGVEHNIEVTGKK